MAFSSTMNRLAAILLALVLAATAAAAEVRTVKIAYLNRAGDPFYAHRESYGGIYDATRQSAISGAELGVKDAKIVGRAIEVTFELLRETVPEGAAEADFVKELVQRENPWAIILDLPASDVETVAILFGQDGAALFNIRHRSSDLRQKTCQTNLFHVIASDAMLTDSLTQYLKFVGWDEVLVLTSNSPTDLAEAQLFQTSAQKYGLTIADVRQFVQGNDPRQRDLNSVRLLTGGIDYDAVFVADETREFARLLPYRTVSPRPVLGAAGLSPLAWHWQWERNGAPQLNRRFFKLAGRVMTEEDWAAWVAVKSVVEAHVRAGSSSGPLVRELLKPDFNLELYKGYPGSFRPWDRQLRQSILLATVDTVVALAPVEGALHQFNNLDTLGLDEPEFICP